MSIFAELKRRNVFRVAIAYLALAWLLIEVADTLFPAFGIPDWAFRFTVMLLALGFLPTLLFSWAYEITPEGLKREKDVTRDESITHITAKRLDALTIGMIVIAMAVIGIDRLWLSDRSVAVPAEKSPGAAYSMETEDTQPLDSIAVLPFASRSANPDDAFFVEGIHDDLLTNISQIGSLKTISRTSVMRYQGSTLPIPEIARELGVTAILEGGVQRSGNQVRINVQLIDARSDTHIWADTYDRELTASNIFAIQSEIAAAVAETLRATLSPQDQQRIQKIPTRQLAALESFFQGRQQLAKRTVDSMAQAIDHFRQAIREDPEFALAYVGLADAERLHAGYSGASYEDWKSADERALASLDRALSLDPALGEAYASLGTLLEDPDASEAAFRRALELSPNYAPGYQWYGEWLGWHDRSRLAEALELSRKAVELDPLSAIINNDLGEVLFQAGRYEEALAQFEKAIGIEPGFASGYRRIGELHALGRGRFDEAVLAFRKSFALEPDRWETADMLSGFYTQLGDLEESARWLDVALELMPGQQLPDMFFLDALRRQEFQDPLIERARDRLASYAKDHIAIWFLTDYELSIGRADNARAIYEAGFPELASAEPTITFRNYWVAVDLSDALIRTGEQGRALRLLDQCLAYVKTLPRMGGWIGQGHGVEDARIHALRGDRTAALKALQEAIDQGWRLDWWYHLELDPALESLHDDPVFKAMRQEVAADMAAQLTRLREVE